MMRLRQKGSGQISVFYVDGIFVRVFSFSRHGTYMHAKHACDLVGCYDRKAVRDDILDDIYWYINDLHAQSETAKRARQEAKQATA